MEILGEINDITLSPWDFKGGKKIKIRTVRDNPNQVIIDKLELIIDEKGKIIVQ